MTPDPGPELAHGRRLQTFRPQQHEVGDADDDAPTGVGGVADFEAERLRRLGRSGEADGRPVVVEPPGRDVAGAGAQSHPALGPAEVEGELRGAAGAVETEVGRQAVGVEVVHRGSGFGSPQNEEPVRSDRHPPPGTRRGMRSAEGFSQGSASARKSLPLPESL